MLTGFSLSSVFKIFSIISYECVFMNFCLDHFKHFHWNLHLGEEIFLQYFLIIYIKFDLLYQQACDLYFDCISNKCPPKLLFSLFASFYLFTFCFLKILPVSLIWFSSLSNLFTPFIKFPVFYHNSFSVNEQLQKLIQKGIAAYFVYVHSIHRDTYACQLLSIAK